MGVSECFLYPVPAHLIHWRDTQSHMPASAWPPWPQMVDLRVKGQEALTDVLECLVLIVGAKGARLVG